MQLRYVYVQYEYQSWTVKFTFQGLVNLEIVNSKENKLISLAQKLGSICGKNWATFSLLLLSVISF